jgi:hypothetical protein
MTPGRGAKSSRAAFPQLHRCVENFSGGSLLAARSAYQTAGDRYHTKKYASAMIAAIAAPNHIMGWVMFWLWVSVVMNSPFLIGGDRGAGTSRSSPILSY